MELGVARPIGPFKVTAYKRRDGTFEVKWRLLLWGTPFMYMDRIEGTKFCDENVFAMRRCAEKSLVMRIDQLEVASAQ